MLLRASDEESGEGMTDRQLRDEILTMFLAGQETTSTGITWTWYVLSRYPDVRRRVHEEWARVLEGRVPTAADLPRLEYTMMVISESMRVYPPVWFMMRNAVENDEIGGCEIAAGSDRGCEICADADPAGLSHNRTTLSIGDRTRPARGASCRFQPPAPTCLSALMWSTIIPISGLGQRSLTPSDSGPIGWPADPAFTTCLLEEARASALEPALR